jgi:ribosomal protein S18 acetylase RimI-like enzyme
MTLRWRPARAADAAAIGALSRALVSAPPERDEVFAERIALCPAGCRVYGAGEAVAGYVISHPWPRSAPPALGALVGALPPDSDSWFIHDLALAPEARGAGVVASVLEELEAAAQGFPAMSLVAVEAAADYWRRRGYVDRSTPVMAAKLAGYGPGALYMERDLPTRR